jgi:hypothetical protein
MEYDLYDLIKELSGKGILISFNGPFSHDIIEEIGKAIRNYLNNKQLKKSIILDLFSLFIEQAQNTKNYIVSKDWDKTNGAKKDLSIVLIGQNDDKYWVCSGNFIENDHGAALAQRIESINNLTKEELKILYKKQARSELSPGQKGIGLGLIYMGREATEPIQYSIKKIDDKISFFSIKVIISFSGEIIWKT